MADELGAVRRTPRSTGDRQTPETVAQPGAGTTNDASPVSGDQPAVSSRVSSRPEFGDPEAPRRDPVGTVREHDDGTTAVKVSMGDDTGKGQHVWCRMKLDLEVRWLHHYEVAEWPQVDPEKSDAFAELEGAFATVCAELDALKAPGFDTPEYAALPDCTACGGTGKDNHGSPFEAPLAVHFAGPPVKAEGRRRQLCMWCGHVLEDVPVNSGEAAWPAWPVGFLVRIDGVRHGFPYDGGELPPGCCALPDDEEPTPGPGCYPPADGWDGASTADVPVDPNDGYPVDLCGKHTGTCSNRCLLPAHHDGECDDDPRPDKAQETRAAADWPAEEADRG